MPTDVSEARIAPYGGWDSPITAGLIVSETIGLGSPTVDGQDIYWLEMRPGEGGRSVLVRRRADGIAEDVTPAGFNVRTRVHEYGGGAYAVHDGGIYFSNFSDQRLYRHRPGAEPQPITPAGDLRYADAVVDMHRQRLVCVREDHRVRGREPQNTLVGLALDAPGDDAGQVLASGADFYASARLSPDGGHLAWLSWDHPNMPWDGTRLWVAPVGEGGALGEPLQVAGGDDESVFEPQWAADGVLHFVSDRTGWWNLYRWNDRRVEALCPMDAEFGLPQWVFGMSTYAFGQDGEILCAYTRDGRWHLASLDPGQAHLAPIQVSYTAIQDVVAGPAGLVFTAGAPELPTAIVRLAPGPGPVQVLRRSSEMGLDDRWLSSPEPMEFPTEGGRTAHALFYAPRNPNYRAPSGQRPPLLVQSHGGPTAAASSTLNLSVQFWTSRGFAVVDVNYGGSTGYGRAYRERLNGRWGIVDVDDCVNAARHLVRQGRVDADRLAIRGRSAGGYTTLAALSFREVFKAGASHYGISELESLAADTHKFESRYLDRMVGPYPEDREIYRARSPIHHVAGLSAPVIFFQGLEDRVVPPSQAEKMVEALRAKGLPVAYVAFEGEQHGFRQAANIKRALEAELYFYARIFGFEPAEDLEPIPIENLRQ